MCSTLTDLSSMLMAFSTGMTCMPMPAPPGGTILVIFSRGSLVMRLKKYPSSGCSQRRLGFITVNSADPGTNMGTSQRFSCSGFWPSRFSQLYSSTPIHERCSSMSVSFSSSRPEACLICSKVLGFLMPPNERQSSASSSVKMVASAQYSGSLVPSFFTPRCWRAREVIIFDSLIMGSLTGASGS